MTDDVGSIEECPLRELRFLLCDITDNVDELSLSDHWVNNLIQCLDIAVDRKPEIIVIRFGHMPIPEYEDMLQLCAALKRNSHTCKFPILALLHSKHRKLIEDLARQKVDYIRCIGDEKLNSSRLTDIIDGLGPNDRLERHLAVICPFLHYSKIETQHEMCVCGAYLDRMVLGGRRLHEICETERHLQCEYYLNPRSNP